MADESEKVKEGWGGIGKWWFAAAVFMLIVLLGLIFVLLPIGDDDDDSTDPGGNETTVPTGTTDPGDDTDTPDVPPSGYVTLPRSTSDTLGYPTGYPHTPEGAAALAAVFQELPGSIEYDSALRQVKAYITGIAAAEEQDFADEVVSTVRSRLDIPLAGDPLPGASAAVAVDAVKWEARDEDHVAVSFTTTTVYTNVDGEQEIEQSAMSVPVVWSDGRWWLDNDDASELPAVEYAEPGTPEFEQAGWKVIRNSDWRWEEGIWEGGQS